MRSIPIYSASAPVQRPQPAPAPLLKGRGTAWSLAHRFCKDERLAYDDGWGTLDQTALEQPPAPTTQVLEEQVKSILVGNDSPDIGFVMARIREMRGGADNSSRFGERMTGSGIWAQLLRQRFHKASAKLGLNQARTELDLTQFRRASRPNEAPAQASLF